MGEKMLFFKLEFFEELPDVGRAAVYNVYASFKLLSELKLLIAALDLIFAQVVMMSCCFVCAFML